MRNLGIAGAMALLACSTAGWTQNEMSATPAAPAVAAGASIKPKSDPNKIVCETVRDSRHKAGRSS
jgi:hypothetical protein